MDRAADEILTFWIEEVGPEGWYTVDPGLDERIRDQFGEMWQHASDVRYHPWMTRPRVSAALIILLDQFSRNMFRGSGTAFSQDIRALALAKRAIGQGHDLAVEPPLRQFFYLPFMHSERIAEQARSVRLYFMRNNIADSLQHARAHREVIRRFGRFPFRNAVLGRRSSDAERAWLEEGAYAATLAALDA